MTRMLNYCVEGGYLASQQSTRPVDRTDYQWASRSPIVGCVEFFCQACRKVVRAVDARCPAGRLEPDDCAALYASESLATDPRLIEAPPPARLHLCACAWVVAHETRSVRYYLDVQLVPLRWRCGGHKPVVEGAVVEGVTVVHPMGWLALAPIAELPSVDERHRALVRLFHRLAGTPNQQELLALLVGALAEAGERLAQAVRFFASVGQAGAAGALVEALAAGRIPDDLVGGADEPPFASLRYNALYALVSAAEEGADRGELSLHVRRGMLDGRVARWLAHRWLPLDGPWMLDNVERILAAAPDFAGELLLDLGVERAAGKLRFEPTALASAVSRVGGVNPKAVAAYHATEFGAGRDFHEAVMAVFRG
ncbi:MAG: hypothetical protein IT382_00840 [Deltaproteobacteria bacterium]|nr:hypothetical protein [Deltaproteobacteria bacterium]